MGIKLAIVGSRNLNKGKETNYRMYSIVEALCPYTDYIISGGANGVDKCAETVHSMLGCHKDIKIIKPDWTKHGNAAGPIRNSEIVEQCDKLIAFWDFKSRGTKDSIQKAFTANKLLAIINISAIESET